MEAAQMLTQNMTMAYQITQEEDHISRTNLENLAGRYRNQIQARNTLQLEYRILNRRYNGDVILMLDHNTTRVQTQNTIETTEERNTHNRQVKAIYTKLMEMYTRLMSLKEFGDSIRRQAVVIKEDTRKRSEMIRETGIRVQDIENTHHQIHENRIGDHIMKISQNLHTNKLKQKLLEVSIGFGYTEIEIIRMGMDTIKQEMTTLGDRRNPTEE